MRRESSLFWNVHVVWIVVSKEYNHPWTVVPVVILQRKFILCFISEGLSHISYVITPYDYVCETEFIRCCENFHFWSLLTHIELRRLQIVDIKSDLTISVLQVRSTGAIDVLTHQPVKGRRRGGGVRFGEMERDSLLSHGSAFLLQDRLFHCSDKTAVSWS